MKKLQRLSLARAAMMLLMMLTTVTAWGFKTETTIYSVSLNGDHYFNIYDGSSTTASWAAEAQYVQSEKPKAQ